MPKPDETQALIDEGRRYIYALRSSDWIVTADKYEAALAALERDHAIVERVRKLLVTPTSGTYLGDLIEVLEAPPQTLEPTASAIAHPDERHGSGVIDDNYVAWLRYVNGTIKTCDSDSKGAFKVWRRPPAPAPSDARERAIDTLLHMFRCETESLQRGHAKYFVDTILAAAQPR